METRSYETSYQQIGALASAQAFDSVGKILLYAEVGDGWSSADLIYQTSPKSARHRFCEDKLREVVIDFWEYWKEDSKNQEWRCIEYVIENENFKIDLTYPDQIDENQATFERRPAVIDKHFGGVEIDYSNPE